MVISCDEMDMGVEILLCLGKCLARGYFTSPPEQVQETRKIQGKIDVKQYSPRP